MATLRFYSEANEGGARLPVTYEIFSGRAKKRSDELNGRLADIFANSMPALIGGSSNFPEALARLWEMASVKFDANF